MTTKILFHFILIFMHFCKSTVRRSLRSKIFFANDCFTLILSLDIPYHNDLGIYSHTSGFVRLHSCIQSILYMGFYDQGILNTALIVFIHHDLLQAWLFLFWLNPINETLHFYIFCTTLRKISRKKKHSGNSSSSDWFSIYFPLFLCSP